MKTSMLVGYTGFVGSNLDMAHDFTWRINTKNKEEAYGKNPELLVYAGLRAEKFLANKDPEADMEKIQEAFEQIKKINPSKLVLISTVDVYKKPVSVDENTKIDTSDLLPYGKNRYQLETMVREYQKDALIIRLPGLYGKNMKKNFIYDLIHIIPSLLKEDKYLELSVLQVKIKDAYEKQENGFYRCIYQDIPENYLKREELKQAFLKTGFSALSFTDSRGVFQFYDLSDLWKDIQTALSANLTLLNIATEPVSVGEIYRQITGKEFDNQITDNPPYYDYQSCHATLFGGANGYFTDREAVLEKITDFIRGKSGNGVLKSQTLSGENPETVF